MHTNYVVLYSGLVVSRDLVLWTELVYLPGITYCYVNTDAGLARGIYQSMWTLLVLYKQSIDPLTLNGVKRFCFQGLPRTHPSSFMKINQVISPFPEFISLLPQPCFFMFRQMYQSCVTGPDNEQNLPTSICMYKKFLVTNIRNNNKIYCG